VANNARLSIIFFTVDQLRHSAIDIEHMFMPSSDIAHTTGATNKYLLINFLLTVALHFLIESSVLQFILPRLIRVDIMRAFTIGLATVLLFFILDCRAFSIDFSVQGFNVPYLDSLVSRTFFLTEGEFDPLPRCRFVSFANSIVAGSHLGEVVPFFIFVAAIFSLM
jgi:hypothetical protein